MSAHPCRTRPPPPRPTPLRPASPDAPHPTRARSTIAACVGSGPEPARPICGRTVGTWLGCPMRSCCTRCRGGPSARAGCSELWCTCLYAMHGAVVLLVPVWGGRGHGGGGISAALRALHRAYGRGSCVPSGDAVGAPGMGSPPGMVVAGRSLHMDLAPCEPLNPPGRGCLRDHLLFFWFCFLFC